LTSGVGCDRLERGHGGVLKVDHLLRRRLVLDVLIVGLFGLHHLVVDDNMPELSRGDPVGEQDVELGEGEPACLWETEEAPRGADDVGAQPEEGGFGAEVPAGGVDEAGADLARDETADDIDGAAHDDGLGSDTGVGQLARDRIACSGVRGGTHSREIDRLQRGPILVE
jgi:hypothetical protein